MIHKIADYREMKYDILFVTTIPAFYKVNLFNRIADRKKILVLYTGSNTGKRSNDFLQETVAFDHQFLDGGVKSISQVMRVLVANRYSKVVISGWDNVASYVIAFLSRKKRNSCIVESSIYESATKGWKAFPKKILLKRMSTVLASGEAQAELVSSLGFKGEVVKFGGCGILNYVEQPSYEPRSEIRDFLYVGQLIDVKNVSLLVKYFNRHPEKHLTIIGTGVLREVLEKEAGCNIKFLGAINNMELPEYYRKADVFVLPSKSEPWGLVVEEALNNGTPVIVSDRVGCATSLVVPNGTGLVFKNDDLESFDKCVDEITNIECYNLLRLNVSKLNFAQRAEYQVECFCN